MRYIDLISEDFSHFSGQELEGMKDIIASKIKKLPDDDATAKTLKEIEELLQHVNAGGRMGMIRGQLEQIGDPAVMAAQKRLASYLASMEVEPADRAELFKLWRDGSLVNIDKLLSKKSIGFADIFNKYGVNKAITELVDDVMSVADLGQGKGEFGLNVLSKFVSKPGKFVTNNTDDDEEQAENKLKGDLLVNYPPNSKKWIKVEVKTTHGGGARFSDQEVRPAEGYEQAANELNQFVEKLQGTTAYQTVLPKGLAKGYGLNMRSAIELYSSFLSQGKFGPPYLKMVEDVITKIFGGPEADRKRVSAIMSAFKTGNANEAIQQYTQASFNYYMSKKDDEGVLAININSKTAMFYSDANDLTKQKLRLHSDTIYLTAKDVARGAYPQLSVMPTTFGANAKAAADKQARQNAIQTAKKNPVPVPDITGAKKKQVETMVHDFITNMATAKGVFDDEVIDQATFAAMDLLVQGVPQPKIKSQINAILNQSKQGQAPAAEEPAVDDTATPAPATAPTAPAPTATAQPTVAQDSMRTKRKAPSIPSMAESIGRGRRR